MENDFITVDSLRERLNELSKIGYGDMKIKCHDGYLHDDEIGYNYLNREIQLRGHLFNFSLTERVQKFRNGVEKLYQEFYGNTPE